MARIGLTAARLGASNPQRAEHDRPSDATESHAELSQTIEQ